MKKTTKNTFKVAVLLCIICIACIVVSNVISYCYSSIATVADSEGNNALHFFVDGGNMYFFDSSEKIIYLYSSRGEFRRAYQIEKLGSRLKTFSSNEVRNMVIDN